MNIHADSTAVLERPPAPATIPKRVACRGRRVTAACVLVVLEGTNDIQFLKRLSALLHANDHHVPNLWQWERQGRVVFMPAGGGDPQGWADRLGPLGCPEFHLYDRETPPETEARQRAVERINTRRNSEARLMRKRSLENYLHPAAIAEAGGPQVEFGDDEPVAELVACGFYDAQRPLVPWGALPRRFRKRRCERAKKWLNRCAVGRMTAERLAERDPAGEVPSWLAVIAGLAGLNRR